MDYQLLFHLAIGPLIFLIAWITKQYPPKKINHTYGYRTPRSMKNQETWDFANQHSTETMFKMSVYTMIFQAVSILVLDAKASILASAAVMVITLIGGVIITERALRANFDKEGNRIKG